MKILVASDSFKGTISSQRIGEIISEELSEFHKVDFIPVSDGGEGFIDAVRDSFKGSIREVRVKDPLGRNIIAPYLLSSDRKTAIIESSAANGLSLLSEDERNPMKTSTYGVGQLVKDAIGQGVDSIYIGLGGSSTNDGGTGLLEALGVKFFNSKGFQLTGLKGESVLEISSLEMASFVKMTSNIRIIIVSDVNNTLLGNEGATYTYGPQKGAGKDMLISMELGMKNYADVINRQTMGDHSEVPGAGAAGGMGFCLLSFFNSEIRSGIETVLDLVGFDNMAGQYDLLITGEGKIDRQSLRGKVLDGVIRKTKINNTPVIAVCALSELETLPGIEKIFSVVPGFSSKNESLKNPEKSLRKMVHTGLLPWIS